MKPALLILGPTGSGKSPLGDYLEHHGLNSFSFSHFDFGELLRQTAQRTWHCGMTDAEISYIQKVLHEGALLENETRHLIGKIIEHFLNEASSASHVVLNGLPRHVDQAQDILPYFNVKGILSLECTPEVVIQRIQHNSGGDRTTRTDDQLSLVTKKLETFHIRTRPLISHFVSLGAVFFNMTVQIDTQPKDIVLKLVNSKFSSKL